MGQVSQPAIVGEEMASRLETCPTAVSLGVSWNEQMTNFPVEDLIPILIALAGGGFVVVLMVWAVLMQRQGLIKRRLFGFCDNWWINELRNRSG